MVFPYDCFNLWILKDEIVILLNSNGKRRLKVNIEKGNYTLDNFIKKSKDALSTYLSRNKMAQGGVITKSDVSKMQKINIRGFEAYMPGIRTIYFDQNSGKFFYPFDESEFFELKNDYTLGKLNSFLKEKNITLKTKMAQGGISKNAEYVSKRNIDKVTYHKGKDVKNVSGEDLLDGVYVSKKVGSKKGFYVELASEPDIDYGYDITKKLKLQKVPITSIEDAQSKVRKYIDDNDLGGGNWTGGDVYKDGKKIGRISYNGRWWSEESKEMAQGGGVETEPIYENGSMVSKPYYYESGSGFFTAKGYRVDNKFYDNVYASFDINSFMTKKEAIAKSNAFYKYVKSAKTKDEYDQLAKEFITNWSSKMAQGGYAGWKHKSK
jgi:hypothetical protein